jgi:hypothetical protein
LQKKLGKNAPVSKFAQKEFKFAGILDHLEIFELIWTM